MGEIECMKKLAEDRQAFGEFPVYDVKMRAARDALYDAAGEVVASFRAVSEALTAAGIPDDGRPLAERIASTLGDIDNALAVSVVRRWRGRDRSFVRRIEILTASERQYGQEAFELKEATRAALVTMGGKVPDDAGPEALANTLRDLVNDSEEAGRDFAETQRKMQAEIERLTDAAESAGASAVSERARAEHAEEERDAALRAAKVLGENGALGPAADAILRAAAMLKRIALGSTVEHRCADPATCLLCNVPSAEESAAIVERLGETSEPLTDAALEAIRKRHKYIDDGSLAHLDRGDLLREVDRLRAQVPRESPLEPWPEPTDEEIAAGHKMLRGMGSKDASIAKLQTMGLDVADEHVSTLVKLMTDPGARARHVVAWHDAAHPNGWSVCTTDKDGLAEAAVLESLTETQAKDAARLINDPLTRTRFNGSRARIVVLDAPTQSERRGAAGMREWLNNHPDLALADRPIPVADLARTLVISEDDMRAIEAGTKTTDDAGWKEIQTALFCLGGGMRPEHIADPTSDPALAKALDVKEGADS